MAKKLFIILFLLIYNNTSACDNQVDITTPTNNLEIPDRKIGDILYPKKDRYKGGVSNRTQIFQLLQTAVLESDIDDVQELVNKIKLTSAEKDYLYSLAAAVSHILDEEEDKQFFKPVYRKHDYSSLELNIPAAVAASLCTVYAGKSVAQYLLPQCLNLFHKVIRFQAIFTIPMFIYMILWVQTTKTVRLAWRLHAVEITIIQRRADKIRDLFWDLRMTGLYASPEESLDKCCSACPSTEPVVHQQHDANLYRNASSSLKALICGAVTTACFSGYMLLKS
jgi:hypothetical protein